MSRSPGGFMESKQAMLVYGLMAFVVLCWLVSPSVGTIQEPAWILPKFSLTFEGSRACGMTRDFVTRFPKRVLGSLEARQSTGFLTKQLEALGYQISYMHFDAVIAGRRQVGRNVLAYRQGEIQEIIAVLAHYDTAGTTVQGATDDGSGVGVLLELASMFAAVRTHRSLLFVATDGEEWGMLGALDLARNYPDRSRIAAALSLDYVAPGELGEITLGTVGQTTGFTPPWLRQIARLAALEQSPPVATPYRITEHVERSLLLSETDQGPLLAVGIPAVNLGSDSKDRSRREAIHHSNQDTVDNLSVSSVEQYGRIAEQIVRTLDGLRTIPRESMGSFRLAELVFLSAREMSFLHYVTFLPLLGVLFFHWLNCRKYLSAQRVGRELLALGGTFLPILAAYYIIVLLRLARVIPAYSLYPATLKDPVLERPPAVALGILIGIPLVAAVVCFYTVRFTSRGMVRPDFFVSKLVLVAVLTVLVFLALLYNSYWAVTFLALPAWVWMLVGIGRGAGGRAANRIWIIAAGIPWVAVQVLYAKHLTMGWGIIWYQILALSTGMFTRTAFLLAAVAFSIGMRFLVIQSQSCADQ